ncbi:hypothetical protein LK09_04795 [Microbacterium mangrovi]|uniref:Uncharacterized protein n=1 Tax=Microbacterium mangrovi TaxID=1348253 RepID=A0A0B2A5I1_9MICO|nr:hypothetical protein LK09_04795 [Microbacterium mangrovi]
MAASIRSGLEKCSAQPNGTKGSPTRLTEIVVEPPPRNTALEWSITFEPREPTEIEADDMGTILGKVAAGYDATSAMVSARRARRATRWPEACKARPWTRRSRTMRQ